MPRTIMEKMERIALALPAPLILDLDRLIQRFPESSYNRQKFVEDAIREKMDRFERHQAMRQELYR